MRYWGIIVSGFVAVLSAACSGERFIPEAPDGPMAPDAFRGAERFSADMGDVNPARWWAAFDDPMIADLVDRALDDNLSIQIAEARIREADALTRQAGAARSPRIDLGIIPQGEIVRPFGAEDVSTSAELNAGLRSSWEIDLFGQQRLAVLAAELDEDQRQALKHDLEAVIAADVAATYLDLRAAQQRRDLLADQQDLLQNIRNRVSRQVALGAATQLDLQRLDVEISQFRTRIPTTEVTVGNALSRLQVLLGAEDGRIPNELDVTRDMPNPTALPNPGVPSELLRNRADLRAAEHALEQALIEVGISEAGRMPQLSLPGTIGFVATGFGAQQVVEAVVGTLAANLSVNLLDGGRQEAVRDAAEARVEEAALAYREALMTAVSEVEQALIAMAGAEDRIELLENSIQAQNASLRSLQAMFDAGSVGILDVLDAQRELSERQEELLDAELTRTRSLIAVYRGLGRT